MSTPFSTNNPGIGGLDELTAAEEAFLQNLVGLSYVQGDVLFHNGTDLDRLGYSTSGHVLTTQGIGADPIWAAAGGGTPEGTAVLSTGESVGYVLQADGDNTCSWVALGGGGDALTANPLSQFAATTSAQLAGVMSDETGTGALVFGTAPTFTTSITIGSATIDETELEILDGATLTTTELNYVDGVTSAIQTQLDDKASLTSANSFTVGGQDITVADTTNVVGLTINQNDSTNSPLALQTITSTEAGFYDVEFQNTGADSNGVGIRTYYNTATPADLDTVGYIYFDGRNDNSQDVGYADIEAFSIDVTDTTEDGALRVGIMRAGTFTSMLEVGSESLTTINGISVGATTAAGIVSSRGNQDLTLQTGNATTGSITITDGANGDITLVPNGTGIVKGELKRFMVQLLAEDTAQTTGTTIGGDFRISNRAITVKAVGAYVDTAGVTGTCTIDIHEAGTTIMTTNKITIDTTEKSSETAATAPALTDTAIAADAIVTFDIDAIHSGTAANGLKVWIDYIYA